MSDPLNSSPSLDLKASLKRPLKVGLVVGILTALISLFMPNYYRSEARLLPVDASISGNLGNLAAEAAAFGVNVGGAGSSDANFLDILKSRWLKENLLNTPFSFHARSWRFGTARPRQETLYEYLKEKNIDRAVKALGGMFKAEKDQKTGIITVYAESKSPDLAQAVTRRATDLLNQFVVNNSRTRGSEKAAFAKARLKDARKEMDKAEEALLAFLETNRNYQMSGDPAVRLRGARLEAELTLRRQLVTTLAMNLEQSLLDAKNDLPIVNILDAGNLPIEKSRPFRSQIVLLMMLLSGIGAWAWGNRGWLKKHLFVTDDRA